MESTTAFENRYLRPEAIRQRIVPLSGSKQAPDNLPVVEWTEQDGALTITYTFADAAPGRLLVAGTEKGICFVGFVNRRDADTKADFMRRFDGQPMVQGTGRFESPAIGYCNGDHRLTVPLHLKGTDFQRSVWRQLLCIPPGSLCTYGSLLPGKNHARAIGRAVGANPVSYIIPCHRVVRSNGGFDHYHWGPAIKRQLLIYEAGHHQ